MTTARFIQIHNKFINLNAIDYVEFLESGRSMIFMTGLTQEKQNITVDPEETRKLRAVLDEMVTGDTATSAPPQSWPASIPALRR